MKNILIFLAVTALFSCNSKMDYDKLLKDPILYSKTVYALNTVLMGNNFSPIVASRNYCYANIAAYEVVASAYPDHYASLAGQIKGLTAFEKPVAGQNIHYEFASLLAFCTVGESVAFANESMDQYIDSLKGFAKNHGMPEEMYNNSVQYADAISKSIIAFSKKDMYSETRGMPKYTLTMNDPGKWVPTPPGYSSALEPNWKMIHPLVMDSSNQFMAPAPFKFNMKDKNSAYYKQVLQVKNAVDSLTPEQKHIADFWDDNPFKLNVSGHLMYATKKFSPPGHWQSIIGIAAEKSKADFPTTVYAYAKTSIAMFDAFIQCWQAKFEYTTPRPITVINSYIDNKWEPYLQTPPFPEYTCGHSTCSSAAAEALTNIFGDNFNYTDTSELEFGIKSRSYQSFKAAAEENNWGRFYGGIHFHPTCIVSTEYGKKVGDYVVGKLHMKK
jgi:hypothetical protein